LGDYGEGQPLFWTIIIGWSTALIVECKIEKQRRKEEKRGNQVVDLVRHKENDC
jgi:hypothetical protein